MKTKLRILLTIILTAIVTFAVTIVWVYGSKSKSLFGLNLGDTVVGTAIGSDAAQTKLNNIKDKINDKYLNLGDLDEKQMLEYMIKGYVAGIGDDYTVYYTPEEMSEMARKTDGEYAGIGVYMALNQDTGKVIILSTLPDSPAEKAGLQANDAIININGNIISKDNFTEVPDLIKGKIGTKTTIIIERDGEEKTFEIEIAKVEIKQVSSKMLDDKIGYISLKSFDGNSASQFKKEYESLVEKGAEKLIVDIRNNTGGILDEAVDIIDMFIDADKVILTSKDNKGNIKEVKSKTEKTITMKTVLLVNEYSASASEVTAAALKAYADNVTVIGNTTYGKGLIQILYELSDGSGLKLTVEEYFGPDDLKINKVGVTPDIELEKYQYVGNLDEVNDPQLKRAIEELNKNEE